METMMQFETLLHEGERVVERSGRKPRVFVGGSCLLVGAVLTGGALLRALSGSTFLPDLAVGAVLLYAAVWELLLCTRENVYVTTERVLWCAVTPIGTRGKVRSFPLREIRKARLCKTISFRQYEGGEILLVLSRESHVLPPLKNGLYVLDAIRAERADIAVNERESEEQRISGE